jgi:hypothetical protein
VTGSSIFNRSNDPMPVETRLRNRFVDAGKAAMEDYEER